MQVLQNNFAKLICGGIGLLLISILSNTVNSTESETSVYECLKEVGREYYERNGITVQTLKNCQIKIKKVAQNFQILMETRKQKLPTLTEKEKIVCQSLWNTALETAYAETYRWSSSNKLFSESKYQEFIKNVYFDGQLTYAATQVYFSMQNSGNKSKCISLMNAVALTRDFNLSQALHFDLNNISEINRPLESWAIWLSILHSDGHSEIQLKYSEEYIKLAKDKQFSAQQVAILSDRINNMKGNKLSYGVLYDCKNGKIVHNLDRLDVINKNRMEIGLPSYEKWLQEHKTNKVCQATVK